MRPRISIRGCVHPSVPLSVRPSVGLYKSASDSIRGYVRPSVRRSVGPSVGPSVHQSALFFSHRFLSITAFAQPTRLMLGSVSGLVPLCLHAVFPYIWGYVLLPSLPHLIGLCFYAIFPLCLHAVLPYRGSSFPLNTNGVQKSRSSPWQPRIINKTPSMYLSEVAVCIVISVFFLFLSLSFLYT